MVLSFIATPVTVLLVSAESFTTRHFQLTVPTLKTLVFKIVFTVPAAIAQLSLATQLNTALGL